MRIQDFLASFEMDGSKGPQTHLWMSGNTYSKHGKDGKQSKTLLLHVPQDQWETFYNRLGAFVSNNSVKDLENSYSDFCITEKIYNGKFRMYVDLDFKVQMFEQDILASDKSMYTAQLHRLLDLIKSAIVEYYEEDNIQEWYIALRLPYKIHLYFPNIVTNKDIASAIITRVRELMNGEPEFHTVLEEDEKVVDSSVYNNGLRMLYMHKGRMLKFDTASKQKREDDRKLHSKLMPWWPTTEIYTLVDPITLEKQVFKQDLFRRLSVLVSDDEPLSVCKQFIGGFKGKGKGKAKGTTIGGASSSSTMVANTEQFDCESFMEQEEGETGGSLPLKLKHTMNWLVTNYNHLIPEHRIKLHDRHLVIPLETKECHAAKRVHVSNNQYIIVNYCGSRQLCHECKVSHKILKPNKFSAKMREELFALGVLQSLDLTKRNTKTRSVDKSGGGTDEERAELFKYALTTVPTNNKMDISPFAKYDLTCIDTRNVVFNEQGIYYQLSDKWCEVCNEYHEQPSCYIEALPVGILRMRCSESDRRMQFKSIPNPSMYLDSGLRNALFVNYNFNLTQYHIINNYHDSTGDVDIVFDKLDIFKDDPDLNHLVFEALTGSTFSIARVFHYLAHERFNCTRDRRWFSFNNHRWIPDADQAVFVYLSEELCDIFRHVRDFYKEEMVDPELGKRCFLKINEIVNALNNHKTKTGIIQEAEKYFYERDAYENKMESLHFEDQLDETKNLLCFTNGVYDLDEDVFRDGRPSDCLTKTCRYEFHTESNPDIRAQVLQFFEDIQPNTPERVYMLMHLASCLHGENNQEHYHIYTGSGRNGKSKLQDLIQETFGDYFETVVPELLTRDRPNPEAPTAGTMNLKAKRIIMASEPSANEKFKGNVLKTLTGNDNITGRRLQSNKMVTFKPHFQLIALCNDIPPMDATDKAIFMRGRIIHFPTEFTANPVESHQKLINESLLTLIPRWKHEFMLVLLDYYRQYKTVDAKRLFPPPSVTKLVDEYNVLSSPVRQFWEECTEPSEYNTTVKGMFEGYQKWAIGEGDRRIFTKPLFQKELARICKLAKNTHCHWPNSTTQTAVLNRKLKPDSLARQIEADED